MFGIPSIYLMIAGGVLALGVVGGFYEQGREIHHWHQAYLDDEKTNAVLRQHIVDMANIQAAQTETTAGNVTQVIKVPETTQKIIKEIQDVPVVIPCETPKYPQDVKDAF